MATTIQTSLPLPMILVGALLSIAFFLFLLRRETTGLTRSTRWGITVLRTVMCLLVWFLIAQPRAVTTQKEKFPVTTRLGVDVSGSMSLLDTRGENTARWQDNAEPSPLEVATALTEAAKIRMNLMVRQFNLDQKERQKTRQLLERATEKIRVLESSTDLARLIRPSLEAIGEARQHLDQRDDGETISALERAAGLVTQAATGLRRIAVVAAQEPIPVNEARTRMELVNRWMQQATPLFERLTDAGDVQIFTFAKGMVRTEPGEPFVSGDALGDGTDLYANLNRLVKEEPAEGPRLSLLITDGIASNPAKDAAFSAEVQTHPLLVLPVGDPSTTPDVFIDSLVSPARVRENDTFVARIAVASRHAGPEVVQVSLKGEGNLLVSRDVHLQGDNASQICELEWTATVPGDHELLVEVSPLDGEDQLTNNLQIISCKVVKDKYRVLVCDGKPRWETRYLQNLFKRDASIEMRSQVFEPRHVYPGKALPPPRALPLALELWQKFDVVILGDVNRDQLTPEHQEVLVEYVNSGGNLIILAGSDSMPAAFTGMPLERLLPVMRTRNRAINGTFVIHPPADQSTDPMVDLSKDDGSSMWRILFGLTPQYRISAWSKAKESARRLLVAQDRDSNATYDFLALQRYGNGQVAFAAAPCLYHLRTVFGDRYHARFWRQMIRGICVSNFGFEGDLIQTRLDRPLWGAGAEVRGRVRLTTTSGLPMHDAVFSALLVRGEEVVAQMRPQEDPDRPGDYFVRFPDTEPGEYVIEYKGEEIDPLLRNDRENNRGEANRTFRVLSEQVTKETMHASDPSDFWGHINRLPLAATVSPQTLGLVLDAIDCKPEISVQSSERSLWDVWWLLLAIILVSSGEWFLRRRNGLC